MPPASRRWFPFAALALFAFGLCLAAPSARADTRGEEAVTLPTDFCGDGFFLPVVLRTHLEGEEPLWFFYDTGADYAVVDLDSLERATGRDLHGTQRADLAGATVGTMTFSKFRARVQDLDHLSRAYGRTFDGILPHHSFGDALVVLDYPAGLFRVLRGESLPRPDGRRVFSSRGPGSRPFLEIRIGDRTEKILVDSGSNSALSLDDFGDRAFVAPPRRLSLSARIDGLVLRDMGRLAEALRFGDFTVASPIASETEGTRLLGSPILRHFVVTYDPTRKRIRFEPAADTDEPIRLPPVRGDGVLPKPTEAGFEISHVVPGSPAERAGLRAGDVFTHIDGRSVERRGCRGDRPWEDAPSRTYTVVRDGGTVEIEVENVVLVP